MGNSWAYYDPRGIIPMVELPGKIPVVLPVILTLSKLYTQAMPRREHSAADSGSETLLRHIPPSRVPLPEQCVVCGFWPVCSLPREPFKPHTLWPGNPPSSTQRASILLPTLHSLRPRGLAALEPRASLITSYSPTRARRGRPL